MSILLIILIAFLLFGGLGYGMWGGGAPNHGYYSYGGIGLIVFLLILFLLFGPVLHLHY